MAVHEEEVDPMLRIEAKADRLLTGPFNAGIDWLESARLPHRTRAERIEYTERALEKFIDAQAQQTAFEQAVGQTYVAIAHGLLGHVPDFRLWLQRARRTANDAIETAFTAAVARRGLLALATGADKHAARALVSAFELNSDIISGLTDVLGDSAPVRWSWEIKEREEVILLDELGTHNMTMATLIVQRDDVATEFNA